MKKEIDLKCCLRDGMDLILESSFDGIVIADEKGIMLYVNKAYQRITGTNPKQMIGKNLETAVKEGLIAKSASLKVLKTKEPISILQKTKNGRTMLISASPIFSELTGDIKYVISNCRDITELNELQYKLEETTLLSEKYVKEIRRLRFQQFQDANLIAKSTEMQKVLLIAMEVAGVDCNVLILGESGVGKDVIAKAIHKNSHRAEGPFIKVNCGAIPDNLLESELFGYEEGAFTGASIKGKPGMFELSEKGTIFLDEIGDLPLNLQVKLLDVLQDKKIKRVGGTRDLTINTRIISATNTDLKKKVEYNEFRLDLYYRLNVVCINIPPLRERRDDILLLARHFLDKFNDKYNKNKELSTEIVNFLLCYSFPGNIRELENIVERFVITNEVEFNALAFNQNTMHANEKVESTYPVNDYHKEKMEIIKLYKMLKSTRKVASMIGLSQATVSRRLKKYREEDNSYFQ